MAASISSAGSKSLKEYLKKYESNTNVEEKKKKKKKKKQPDTNSAAAGVLVVDEDPVWQKPVKLEEDDDNDSPDEDKPLVDEDIEVKRMKRLEQLRLRRPYNAIAEDGSGWVSIDPACVNTTKSDSDMSPPRKQRTRNDTPSPEHKLRPSGSASARDNADLSPPRKQRTQNYTPSPEPGLRPLGSVRENADLSPPRKKRRDTPLPGPGPKPARSVGLNSDLSPRRRRGRNDTPSPEPRRKPAREDNDLSPPRQQRRRNGSPSPKRKHGQLAGLDFDLSPPQRHRARNDKPSLGPRRKLISEGIDLSPPRQRWRRFDSPSPKPNKGRGQSAGLDSDLSPPRRRRARNDTHSPEPGHKPVREDTDLSPPRQLWKRHHTLSPELNVSVARAAHQNSSNQDNDLSSPRKSKKDSDLSPPRNAQKEEKGLRRTGLIAGSDIREEISKKRSEDLLRFQEMDPSVTGRGAEAVYRDKIKGERITKKEYLKSKEKKKEKPEEKKLEWGKGLAQKREAEARLQELELEKDKPFARTRDDPDLDKMLKDRMRWGDPMAHLVKKKRSEPVLPDLGENNKMKESGFIIPQDIPNHSWIKRGLDAAPNRYGIRPGRHWDGVDRSNGYEKQLFKRTNEKRATEREAYLWSVADM